MEARREPTDAGVPRLVDEQARQWLAKLHGGGVTAVDRTRFEKWLKEAPENPAVYKRSEQIWRDLRLLDTLADIDIEPLSFMQRLRDRRVLTLAACAVLATLAAAVFLRPSGNGYATRIAEVRELTLPDGTHVALGAHSILRVDFTPTNRRVTLKAGEAFFSVVKDTSRPFYVRAGDTEIRALGTRFDVHQGVREVRVAVTEGAVEVTRGLDELTHSPTRATAERHVLTAGQELVAKGSTAREPPVLIRTVDADQPDAWRRGRLSYENASLAEVIADVNRYSSRQITFADDRLSEMRVTTAFRTDQIEEMLAGLAATYPIIVDADGQDRIVLRPRH